MPQPAQENSNLGFESALSAPENSLLSFETALERLEGIVQRLEEGSLALADALSQYGEAVEYLRHCYQLVEHAERRIELLCGTDAAGNPTLKPFQVDVQGVDTQQNTSATDLLAAKADRRSQRRSRPPKSSKSPLAPEPAPLRNDIDDGRQLF